VVANQDARPTLLRNETQPAGLWLEVDVRARGAWPALGARVEVREGSGGASRRQVREVASGGSYASQHDAVLHFGLAGEGTAALEVLFPDGKRRALRRVPADRVVVVVE
jgi:hypothetical protein